jgi:chromosome segregation ATPase
MLPPSPSPSGGGGGAAPLSSSSAFTSAAQAAAAAAEVELLEALTREQTLRHAAEGRLSATSREVEELSAALFEQANEMVADERRARAALAERVEVLEKRDADKNKRLERLEVAMVRIQNARAALSGAAAAGGGAAAGGRVIVTAPV